MIKIELPEPDGLFRVSEYMEIEPKSGFYIMKNKDMEIIYVGESDNLRKRIRKHFRGRSSTTNKFSHLFEFVEVYYCDAFERKIYEIYAINQFNPPGNVWNNHNMSTAEIRERRQRWLAQLNR